MVETLSSAITFFILLSILSLAILLIGIVAIVSGFKDKKKVSCYRVLIIVYGFILVGLAVSVLILDVKLIAQNLIIMLNTGIMLLGLRRLLEGIIAHKILKQPKTD